MVNFVFSNRAGIRMNLQTDLLGLLGGADNFTIIDKLDSSGSAANIMFQNIQEIRNTKQTLIAFANTNDLRLVAYEGQVLAPVFLNYETLETPANFALVETGAGTEVTVSWDKVTDATGYVLERATDETFETALVVLLAATDELGDPDAPEFVDNTVAATTQYYYRVKAVVANFSSDSAYASDDITTTS